MFNLPFSLLTFPYQLQQEDIQRSENETTKLVKKIYEKLEGIGGEEGVSLFKFAINPESFSDSVENLFYISFLVRDGKVSIEDNQDGIPMLREYGLLPCLAVCYLIKEAIMIHLRVRFGTQDRL